MNIAQKYIEGLKDAYYKTGNAEKWDSFAAVMHGVAKEDLEKLCALYPEIPNSLIQLLETVDGTYWREYAGEKRTLYFLGSDVEEYPYYLLSAEQMLDVEEFSWLEDYINREYEEDVYISERIIDKAQKMKWLHFSDCMNNGGSSQLYIDFSPSKSGKKGQFYA